MIKDFILNNYGHSHLSGFLYVVHLAKIKAKAPNTSMTFLYDDCASHFSTTSTRVERAIRHYKYRATKEKVCNEEFIMNIVYTYRKKPKAPSLEARIKYLESEVKRLNGEIASIRAEGNVPINQ